MPGVADQLARLLAEAWPAGDRPVLGIGLSLPGTIDPVRGVCVDSPVMGSWEGAELAPYLAAVTSGPVYVGNDADVLARSERLGQARHLDHLPGAEGLHRSWSGRIPRAATLVSGHLGGAGEIGHTKVDAAAGRPCRCGRPRSPRDAGGRVGPGGRRAARLGRPVTHIRELVAQATSGDPEAKALLRDRAGRLGGEGRRRPPSTSSICRRLSSVATWRRRSTSTRQASARSV